ncbi:MAG: hypothetical protein ACRER3_11430 [Pseudomonas fluorescens]
MLKAILWMLMGQVCPGGGECVPTHCYESPMFSPPASATTPAFSYTSLIDSGASWGRTVIGYDASGLHCSDICRNAQAAYRVEGDIVRTASSFVLVSTAVKPLASCSSSARTAANKTHTEVHEMVHANKMVTVINNWKAQLGTEHYVSAACSASVASLKQLLENAFNDEDARQHQHLDHAGERRHVAGCPPPNTTSIEAVCGLGGWVCDPPWGNFYPGE